ncbi:MAG: alanine--tRNA ligase [Verrucomicrobiota bacterium]|jgi:alanyl-tRNA synthetase
MMTSRQIRQSYLDFFKSKQHSIVPSSSLMPDSPGLLFTNAGMNQFVPIFLGQVKCPYTPGRAADTQKCIRAGGKHNDLEDVGLDTYHHTFFEMLGNWSFGDYFKKEAIDWAWEYIVDVIKFPPARLYATVYAPNKAKGDPAEFDQEAWDLWAVKFRSVGLDPAIHIVNGNKKDNFWMMGETGPCGPCTELHVDLTPAGDTQGKLVNGTSDRCIEIWNNVFIQYLAKPDGTFEELPAKHVDTGMGFERLCSIIQNTKGFKDFTGIISNYETDVFTPIFAKIAELSGKHYGHTLPQHSNDGALVPTTEQEKIDVAFRVIADHIRNLSCAIADGIQPGNTGRNYVLRRILRRAVRYGRNLGFKEPFFYKLVDVVVDQLGDVFPELVKRQSFVRDTLKAEEVGFNRTLDKGIELFDAEVAHLAKGGVVSGDFAFKLADTFGFPIDLTELMARERGLGVDKSRFDVLMEEARKRGKEGTTVDVVGLDQVKTKDTTPFLGYCQSETSAKVLEVVRLKDKVAVILDQTVAYPEMGGQIGDTGVISCGADVWTLCDTRKNGDVILHTLVGDEAPAVGAEVTVSFDLERRAAIRRNHTATHLLHQALKDVLGEHVQQKGSLVADSALRFDYAALEAPTKEQLRRVEDIVNAQILANTKVGTQEMAIDAARAKGAQALFGEKYGDQVRVVEVPGFSIELCGGTHVSATGDIGSFRFVSEGSLAAGVRRIEAVTGSAAIAEAAKDAALVAELAGAFKCKSADIVDRVQKALDQIKALQKENDELKTKLIAAGADAYLAQAVPCGAFKLITAKVDDVDAAGLASLGHMLRQKIGSGVVVIACETEGKVSLVVAVSDDLLGTIKAGEIIGPAAKEVQGGGGGAPKFAQAGGKNPAGIPAALAKAAELVKAKG